MGFKIAKYTTQIFHDENCDQFLKIITNFYSNKVSFCNVFRHKFHK